ncbi:MAG: transposase [Alistipes sp.]
MSRGRDKHLISKRNEALCRRYHYWTEVQRLRFDDTLRILSEQEFFISEDRIMAILRTAFRSVDNVSVAPVPKVRKPHLTRQMLELFDR